MVQPPATGHVPVMLGRTIELLAPALAGGGTYVDCTLGLGGHAEAVLTACPDARLIGIDRDPDALAIAGERLAPFGDRVALYEAVYDEITEVLAEDGTPRVQAILADLGLSSMQIDRRERGFAYSVDAPLDMRMGPGSGLSAADYAGLTRLSNDFGESTLSLDGLQFRGGSFSTNDPSQGINLGFNWRTISLSNGSAAVATPNTVALTGLGSTPNRCSAAKYTPVSAIPVA